MKLERTLTWPQALVVFALVLLTVLALSYRSERQQDQIRANTEDILQANYEACLANVRVLSRFNQQQDTLAAIERTLAANPEATKVGKQTALARVEAYENARNLPLPECHR